MGGAIALLNAIEHPTSLRGVVLVCTGAKLGVLPSIREGLSIQVRGNSKSGCGTQTIFVKDEFGDNTFCYKRDFEMQ